MCTVDKQTCLQDKGATKEVNFFPRLTDPGYET